MIKYALSWSGGKDSCYSYWKALSQGLKVNCLLNFVNMDSKRPFSHGLNPELIAQQAKCMKIPIFQKRVTWESYETGFKTALQELKREGIEGLITGDIYLQEHKGWIERACNDVEVKAVLPLWNMNTLQLLNDFVEVGFKAVIVSVKTEFFGQDWLGRQLDKELINQLRKIADRLFVVAFSAGWCKDCATNIPVLDLISEETGLEVRIFGGLMTDALNPDRKWRIPPSPPEVETFNVDFTPTIFVFDTESNEMGKIVENPKDGLSLEEEIYEIAKKLNS